MALPLVPIALGALALWAVTRGSPASYSTVLSKSGRKWLTRTLGVTGAGAARKTTVEVWAPAGSFGPHGQLLVATYQQSGSDMATRVALSTGPYATPEMITAAGQDFGIKKPS